MDVTDEGIVTEFNLQFSNASAPIEVTDDGIV